MSVPAIYSDRLVATTGLVIGIVIASLCFIVSFWMAQAPLWLGLAVSSIPLAAAVVLSTLHITVEKSTVCWQFTFGVFRRCVDLSEIVECKAVQGVPFGWGYRAEGATRAWVASGKSFIEISTQGGERLFVNVRDAAAVCTFVRQNEYRRESNEAGC